VAGIYQHKETLNEMTDGQVRRNVIEYTKCYRIH